MKKDSNPPKYESDASIAKLATGVAVFFDQAINISGGIKPSKVSDKKNVIKTPVLENVLVSNSKPSSIVNTYLLNRNRATIIIITGIVTFLMLSTTKE